MRLYMQRLQTLWRRLIIRLTCDQGLHGDNIVVTIDDGGAYELHCTRCGYTSYAAGDEFYWGYDDTSK